MNGRFELYECDGKKGIIDSKTGKIILHYSYDVRGFDDRVIYLNNDKELLIDEVLRKLDFISVKQRFMIVEDAKYKLLGIFDSKNNQMVVFCSCDKIEYVKGGNDFIIYKKGKKKKISYSKLKNLKYHPHGDSIILVNNLSLYFAEPFSISSRSGKKVEIIR